MFAKRLSEVTAQDVRDVVERRVPEGIEVELKAAFDGNPGDRNARDDIAKEIIAFANAYGGTLLVGISEADRSAAAIVPIPACKDVADRLARAIPDLVEPRLPGFECEGVVTEDDGSGGVVILRVPASFLGPHRHTIRPSSTSGQVYVRRNTESLTASMREIHDLVLNQARGGDRLLDMRAKAYQRFDDERRRFTFPNGSQFSGTEAAFVVVAVPIARLQVPDLIGKIGAERQPLTFRVLDPRGNYGIGVPVRGSRSWSPRLRGIRAVTTNSDIGSAFDLGDDGVVTTGFWYSPPTSRVEQGTPPFFLSWLMATAASVLVRLEWARRRAAYPDAQYVLTARLTLSGTWLMGLSDDPDGSGRVPMDGASRIDVPEHLIEGIAGFHDMMLSFERDLVNASGNSYQRGPRIDFETALKE